MNVQKIEEEIKRLESHIDILKLHLKNIQTNCDHQFQGNDYFETCKKCNKVNVLYY